MQCEGDYTCICLRTARTIFLRHLLGADKLPHLPLRWTTHTAHLPVNTAQVLQTLVN